MLLLNLALAALAAAGESPQSWEMDTVHFVEATSFREVEGLPPKIELTFELWCNQQFVRVVREESRRYENSRETEIWLGVLVRELGVSSCRGEKKSQTVDAGTSFSGRQYKIRLIKAGPGEQLAVKSVKPMPKKK